MPTTRASSALVLAALVACAGAAAADPLVLRIPDDRSSAASPRLLLRAPGAHPFGLASVTSPDTTLNDRSVEPPYTNQWDPSIVMHGVEAVAAWYDTEDPQRLQWAFSADSGRSFTDRGVLSPPVAPMRWGPDACLALDEKSGQVWVAAQVGGISTQRSIGVARGTFVGGDVSWEPPVLARTVATVGASSYFVPVVALAADSSNGTLHLLHGEYSDEFGLTDIRIRYQRSTDGGQTWSASALMSSGSWDRGCIQPRLAVPSPGVVLATWVQETGDFTAEIRWRRSTDAGVTFGAEAVAAAPNGVGTRAAGTFWSYSLAAERRANAMGAGRAVIAYTESWDASGETFPDTLAAPQTFETEPNDSAQIATPFTIGDQLLGDLTQGTDPSDTWSTVLAAGEGIQLWVDAFTMQPYEIAVLSPVGELLVSTSEYNALPFEFLAPAAGTYYVRVRAFGNFGSARSYRVRTRNSTPGPGEARDHSEIALVTLEPGGGAWSPPTRIALTPAGYADGMPEVHFADDGHLYLAWWDLSLDPQRVVGTLRIARDPLGPGTPASVVVAEAASNRSTFVPGVWRSGMASEPHRLLVATSDGRYGNPDVRVVSIPIGVRFDPCTGDAALPREYGRMLVSYRNANPYFTEATLTQRIRGSRNWPSSQIQRSNLAPFASDGVGWLVLVRDTAAVGVNTITHSVYFGDSAVVGSCAVPLLVLGCDTLRVQDAVVDLEAPTGLAAADLDRDGHLDLVMSSDAGPYSGLSFALNDAIGGFQPAILWGDGEPSRWPATADLNHDGWPDLVEAVGQDVRVWVNLSSAGQYSADYEQRTPAGLPSGDALFVVPGDFDEDGITDFIATSFTSPDGYVWMLRGNGTAGGWDETFAPAVQLYDGGRVNSVAVADFNEDGIADLVFASPSFATSHVLHVLLGNGSGGKGDGTFTPQPTQTNGGGGGLAPVTGDFNEDGITDLAFTTTRGFIVYLGNGAGGVGDGTFGAPASYGLSQLPSAPTRLVVADVTLDGRADLIANCPVAGMIAVMAGGGAGPVGDGTFALASVRTVGAFPVALVAGDLVDDGIPNVTDVAVANHDGNSITILRGLCDGTLPSDLTLHEPDELPGGPVSPELLPSAWVVGAEQTIRWTAGAAIGAVDVELSRDGGAGWERLASGVVGSEFRWTVTAPGTETAVIRVHDSAVQGWSDATTSPLRIVAPVLAADAPAAPRVAAFALASPNPARGDAAFTLALPRAGAVEVEVFDVAGTRVATLARGAYAAGVHALRWPVTAGRGAPPGVYFVRARGDGFDFTRRVVRR